MTDLRSTLRVVDTLEVAQLRREHAEQQEVIRRLGQQIASLQAQLAASIDIMAPPLAPGLPPPNSFVHMSPTRSGGDLGFYRPPTVPSMPTVPFVPAPMAASSQDGLDFGTVAKMSDSALESLPYGMVTLDSTGRVLTYNDTEARLSGVPVDRVLGKNFFEDVAPCTRVREFYGKFLELVANPGQIRVQSFDFVFQFGHSEQQVSIMIVPARTRGQFRVAMTRRSIERR